MTSAPPTPDASLLLATSAIDYVLGSLSSATTIPRDAPTPCSEWDLRALATHVAGVADGLGMSLSTGAFVMPEPLDSADDPVERAGARVASLRDDLHRAMSTETDAPGLTFALDGAAIEMTVHGWDVARAADREATIPPDLAQDVLALAGSRIPSERDGLPFGLVMPVEVTAGPAERLLGFMGRRLGR
jgi:uncharacterized protein (TIGR03086 family)